MCACLPNARPCAPARLDLLGPTNVAVGKVVRGPPVPLRPDLHAPRLLDQRLVIVPDVLHCARRACVQVSLRAPACGAPWGIATGFRGVGWGPHVSGPAGSPGLPS